MSGSLISGIPTTAGNSYSFTVKVTDSGSPAQTKTQTFTDVTISVGVTITTASVSNGVVGTPYSATLVAQNGQTPYTWSIAVGTLPNGLNLNPTTGVISGTPTAAGNFSFTVKVTDSTTPIAQVTTQPLSIGIASLLTLSSAGFPNGVIGAPYPGGSCSAGGGTPSYTFSLETGTLPAGLSLNPSNCSISGTATTSGTSNFTIKVTDSSSPAQSKSQAFSITIATGLTITSGSVPNGYTGQPYSATLARHKWHNALYVGTHRRRRATPWFGPQYQRNHLRHADHRGNYSFTVQVSDSGSPVQTATKTLSNVSITAGLTITTTDLGAATQSNGYSATLTAANATGTLTWSWTPSGTSSSLPAGLSLDASSGTISGTPNTPGTFSFTVSVKDSFNERNCVSAFDPDCESLRRARGSHLRLQRSSII